MVIPWVTDTLFVGLLVGIVTCFIRSKRKRKMGINASKVSSLETEMPVAPRSDRSLRLSTWDDLAIKILWVANVVYFGISGIGISGEGAMFYLVFYGAVAFPLSLLAFSISPFISGLVQFIISTVLKRVPLAATDDIVCFLLVLLMGYFQWFVLVPRLAKAGRSYINEIAEESPEKGRHLTNSLNWIRITFRWVGCGLLIVMAMSVSNLLSIFLFQGAIVTFFVFRPRKYRQT